MNATSEITRYSGMTRMQVNDFVDQVTTEIRESGRYDPLEIAATLKAMEDIIKGVRKGIADMVIDESGKYAEKTFEVGGVIYTKTNRASFDYSGCDKWNRMKQEIDDLQALMQRISCTVADAETGELITPAQKKVTESITIKLK
jgi:hypothetical protein